MPVSFCFKVPLSCFALIVAFGIIYGEKLTFDSNSATDIIECTDGFTDCVMNCRNTDACISKYIHYHHTSTASVCEINLIGETSA